MLKRRLLNLISYEYFLLFLIICTTAILHIAVISLPPDTIADEQYYVPDGWSVINGHGNSRPEHPPLGKLLIVGNLLLFENDPFNPFSWRLFPVLFGTASIALFYLICRRLKLARNISYFATFLFAFENLTFIQASIAMLDVFGLTFMLLCFWLYLRGSYIFSGVSVALAALIKVTGILALPAIALHWLFIRRDHPFPFITGIIVAGVAFVALLPVLNFPIYNQWVHPLESIQNMFSLSSSTKFNIAVNAGMTRPWEWLMFPMALPYWLKPQYQGAISYTIWALIIPSMIYIIWRIWKRTDLNADIFVFSWFTATFLLLIPASLITDRATYLYYFYPTIGAICIAVGTGLSSIWDLRHRVKSKWRHTATWSVTGYLILHLAIFIIMGPFCTL